VLLTVLSLSFLVPAVAFASPAARATSGVRANADANKFPMKAADFQKLVDERMKKARDKMEARLAKKNASDDQKKQARAKFDAGAAEVRKVVAEVSADGVVTREEAQKVRETARHARGGRGHGKSAKK
jgi:hypothetical protein